MTDYATLVQDIQDYAEDDSTEFVTDIPGFITRAEEQIFRNMPTNLEYNAEATGTLTASVKTLAHGKAALRNIREFWVTNGSNKVRLDRRSESFIDLYTPDSTTTGLPKFYAQKDNDTIVFAPTPDAGYSYTLRYRAIPTGLSAGQTTTWFSTNQYDMLLDACMVRASMWKEDDEAIARYKASFTEKMAAFQSESLSSYKNDDTTGV